jgi:hypothetical protein
MMAVVPMVARPPVIVIAVPSARGSWDSERKQTSAHKTGSKTNHLIASKWQAPHLWALLWPFAGKDVSRG